MVMFLPSKKRRQQFSQALAVQKPAENLENDCQNCSNFSEEAKSDGVVLRVLPDYGEVFFAIFWPLYGHFCAFLCLFDPF